MSKLILQPDIPRFLVILSFGGAFRCILIVRLMHDYTS